MGFSHLSGFFISHICFAVLLGFRMHSMKFPVAHDVLLDSYLLICKFGDNIFPMRMVHFDAFTLDLSGFRRVEAFRDAWKLC